MTDRAAWRRALNVLRHEGLRGIGHRLQHHVRKTMPPKVQWEAMADLAQGQCAARAETLFADWHVQTTRIRHVRNPADRIVPVYRWSGAGWRCAGSDDSHVALADLPDEAALVLTSPWQPSLDVLNRAASIVLLDHHGIAAWRLAPDGEGAINPVDPVTLMTGNKSGCILARAGLVRRLAEGGATGKLQYRQIPLPGSVPAEAPLVSVITRTTGQRMVQLQETIASVLNQSYPNIEHIVVQDGGDSVERLCHQVETIYGRPCRHLHGSTGGRSNALNTGVRAARGALVLLLDDDDLIGYDHIAALVEVLTAQPAGPAAYSMAWEVETASLPQGRYAEHRYILHQNTFLPFSRTRLLRANFLSIQSVLFRREAFEACGAVDEALALLEDWDLWRRMSALGDFARLGRVTSLYRVPHDAAVRQQRQEDLRAARAVLDSKAMRDPLPTRSRLVAKFERGL